MSTTPSPDSIPDATPAGPAQPGVRLSWIRQQLRIADGILDNPGGGLVFGYQALGQARAHLAESGDPRFEPARADLAEAERQAVFRNFTQARGLIAAALAKLADS